MLSIWVIKNPVGVGITPSTIVVRPRGAGQTEVRLLKLYVSVQKGQITQHKTYHLVVDRLQVVQNDREEVLTLQQTQLDEHAFTADTAGTPQGVETLRFLRQLRGTRFGLTVVTLKGKGRKR